MPKRKVITIDHREHGPYRYCHTLEYALCELYGLKSSWHHTAGGFRDPRAVRKAILGAIRKMRQRLHSILTADDRLLLTVGIELDAMERAAKALRKDGSGLLDLLAHTLHLAIRLLGYDWMTGVPNREVIYFQTQAQQWWDDRHRNSDDWFLGQQAREAEALEATVGNLFEQDLRVSQIARIMNMPESRVKSVLVRQGKLTRGTNVADPT
jgi:ribosomal protein S8E